MSLNKCRYCGGTLSFNKQDECYVCDYCLNPYIPADYVDEELQQIKDRANKLYLACDFEGAATLYQSVVSKSVDDAEAYWFLTLCEYGVQYVDDPATGKRIPTCHRTMYTSILNSEDYINAVDCADIMSKNIYTREAEKIDTIESNDFSSIRSPIEITLCSGFYFNKYR